MRQRDYQEEAAALPYMMRMPDPAIRAVWASRKFGKSWLRIVEEWFAVRPQIVGHLAASFDQMEMNA